MDQEKKQNRKECEKCGSKFIYIRIKNKEVVCRSCNHITKIKEQED